MKKIKNKISTRLKGNEKIDIAETFLSNINHEFRTPMNAIMGLCDLLRRNDYEKDKQNDILETVYKNGVRLLDHVNNLIDFSLIKNDRMKPVPKAFHLNHFMTEVFNEYNNKAIELNKNNLTLHLKKSLDDKNDYIISDDIILSKIISLLMNNALKYTEKGTIELGYDPLGRKELIFFVKDTGVGIPKEKRKKIFNTFRQGSEGLSRKDSGLGIGLSLALEMIKSVNGTIGYRNNKPNGSTFYFTIPFKQADKRFNGHHQMTRYFEDKKIIIADHNFENYLHTRSILSQYPLEIIYLNEKDKIIDYCSDHKNKPDMIIINTESCNKPFDHLIRDIKKINTGIPVIIQTKNKNDFKALRNNVGCDDYIMRPFDTYTLIEKISKHISKS